jgi:transposase
MARNTIGVDLAKDFLEVCDPVRGRSRVANRPKAVARWVAGLGETDFVVYEATSGCDRPLRVALAEAGRPGARVNPLHAWHYARSRNRAKTDRLDAALLADYGRERQPAPDPALDPAREALRALVGRRDQLRRMQVQEKNRLSGALAEGAPALVIRDVRAGLARLARSLATIEAAIRAEVAGDATLARDARLLRSIPDIGPVTAVTLLAWLAELGHTCRRAAASLAGVAPRARDSGKHRGRRFLGDGRRQVRRALYMAALSELRHPGFLADFVRRMKEAGKPGKVILMAVARRLLVVANAVLRTGEPFRTAIPRAA